MQLALCAILLFVLSFTTSDTLTKLTKQAIKNAQNVLYTDTEMWYRSTTNETIRLSQPDQPLPLPAPLLPYETVFMELSNNRVLMYAFEGPASTPFYVIDGVILTQYSHLPITEKNTLYK